MYTNIKFFPNLQSDTHCFQASLRMVLSALSPKENYSFKKLDQITGHTKKYWTYPYQAELWLAQQGFLVVHHENFPVKKFIEKGEEFLKNYWDEEVYLLQKKYSNFKKAQERAAEAFESKKVRYVHKKGGVQDVIRYLEKGFVVMVRVNPFTLRREKGNGSHMIVILGYDKKFFTLHDPGLPPQPNLTVTHSLLKKAMWDDNSLIIAIKKAK